MLNNFQLAPPVRAGQNEPQAIQQFSRIWIQSIKGIAILGIILNHIIEPLFGAPLIGFPSGDWGSLSDRFVQLQPLSLGLWTIPINLLRYLGWMGNYGVALFIIASGFGLTMSQLRRTSDPNALSRNAFNYRKFWLSRCERIYPMWLVIHAVFIISWLVTGWGLSATNWRTWVSLSGWRIVPSTPYYFAGAWWFIGLILQLYLLYPLLWKGFWQWGAKRFLGYACLLGFGVRAIGFFGLPQLISAFSMGIFGIARLPEFALGMVLAYAVTEFPRQTDQFIRKSIWVSLALWVVGTAAGLTLSGAIFFHFLTGSGLSLLFYLAFSKAISGQCSAIVAICCWFGRHSYSLFLIHGPILVLLLPLTGWQTQPGLNLLRVLAACLLSVIAARLLEQVTDFCLRSYKALPHWKSDLN
jgi:peptidoglycan/LPS O-acetylase OafA/YrhL